MVQLDGKKGGSLGVTVCVPGTECRTMEGSLANNNKEIVFGSGKKDSSKRFSLGSEELVLKRSMENPNVEKSEYHKKTNLPNMMGLENIHKMSVVCSKKLSDNPCYLVSQDHEGKTVVNHMESTGKKNILKKYDNEKFNKKRKHLVELGKVECPQSPSKKCNITVTTNGLGIAKNMIMGYMNRNPHPSPPPPKK